MSNGFQLLNIVVFAVLFVGFFVLYFLPSLIGARKRNTNAIFALNLLLGWTVIGWIAALVWALTVEDTSPIRPRPIVQNPQRWTCSRCGTALHRSEKFCHSCGTPIAWPQS